ncbi:MAG: amidohydrolase family protein [Sphaerochaetaceae bacterium]
MKRTLYTHCNLIDCVSDEVKPDSWILIEGNRISKIGTGNDYPKDQDIPVVDVGNEYLMPGLINLHVHIHRRFFHYPSIKGSFKQRAKAINSADINKRMLLSLKNAWDELQHGCTTIRDVSSKDRLANFLRDCINEGIFNGPRVFSSGYGIACTGGHGTHAFGDSVEADGPDEFRKAARMEIKCGADIVKLKGGGGLGSMPKEHPYWEELTMDELRAAIEEGHKRDKHVTIHAMGTQVIKNALKAGIDGIEHGCVLDEECLDIMAAHDVHFCPTMSGITGVAQREKDFGNPEVAEIMFRDVVWKQRESVKKAHERGILLGCGTDTQGDMLIEMDLFEQCGLSPIEALRTATANAAIFVDLGDQLGTIEQGKIADMIIVKENPLENIYHLSNLTMVLKDGVKVSEQWMCNLHNW